MKIYFKGIIGKKGAFELLDRNREAFEKKFPDFFVKQTEALRNFEISDKITIEKNRDCNIICNIGEGGIFRALWEGCAALGTGCEVFLKAIPARQEIIEICELYGENPYELDSEGSLLVFAEGDSCPETVNSSGAFEHEIFGTLIGHTTDNKDRVVIGGESRRFLTPPGRQEKDAGNRKLATLQNMGMQLGSAKSKCF